MAAIKLPFGLRLKLALGAIARVLAKPPYAVLALVTGVVVLGILVWIANFELLVAIWGSTLSLGAKLQFYLSGYESLVTNFHPLGATILVTFAVLSGANLALLVYVVQHSAKEAASAGGKNLGAIIAAAVGAGCAACGTSFLAPVLASVSVAATLTITAVVGWIANILGLGLLCYSIFALALQAATHLAKEKN